jgi:hypothetical protein
MRVGPIDTERCAEKKFNRYLCVATHFAAFIGATLKRRSRSRHARCKWKNASWHGTPRDTPRGTRRAVMRTKSALYRTIGDIGSRVLPCGVRASSVECRAPPWASVRVEGGRGLSAFHRRPVACFAWMIPGLRSRREDRIEVAEFVKVPNLNESSEVSRLPLPVRMAISDTKE